jgi:hypothetical protein
LRLSLSTPWLRLLLAALTAFALGFALFYGVTLLRGRTVEGRSPPDVLVPRPGEVPQLSLALESEGRVLLAAPGRLALPRNTRFALSLQADRPGVFELHTLNAAGKASSGAIWQSTAQAAQRLRSPDLRTEGQGGTQTLRVVFKPSGFGLPREEQFIIWHP